jgi:ribose transport system substrate-binding protein
MSRDKPAAATSRSRFSLRRVRIPAFALLVASGAITLSLAVISTDASGSAQARAHMASAKSSVLPKSRVNIAVVTNNISTYWNDGPAAVKSVAALTGVNVKWVVSPSTTGEPSVQISTLDSLVAKGYTGLVVAPTGESAMMPTYRRIVARGIPIVDFALCSTPPTPALLCVATNTKASAYEQTQILIKKMGGKGNIALLTGNLTDPNTALREAGTKEAVAATHGAVHLVKIVSNIDSASAAPPAVQALFASQGSNLQGILSTANYPSIAAAAIYATNPQYRHIVFIAQDNAPTVMSAIKKGTIYGTMFQNPPGMMYVAAYYMYKILHDGCTIRSNAPWSAGTDVPHLVNAGYFFVGRSTVSKFSSGVESIPSATTDLVKDYSRYLSCP